MSARELAIEIATGPIDGMVARAERIISVLESALASTRERLAAAELELRAWGVVAEWLGVDGSRQIQVHGGQLVARRGEYRNFDGWEAEWTIVTVASKGTVAALCDVLRPGWR